MAACPIMEGLQFPDSIEDKLPSIVFNSAPSPETVRDQILKALPEGEPVLINSKIGGHEFRVKAKKIKDTDFQMMIVEFDNEQITVNYKELHHKAIDVADKLAGHTDINEFERQVREILAAKK